jgi:multidrug efflux pump subunit AcrA (membrane-fusion protein)
VPNEADNLRPGMSFRVGAEILGESYPVVAETGVQWGSDGAYVWSIENGTATRVPVEIVQRREGRVLISGDLYDGGIVVVEGIQRMQEGIDVIYEPQAVAERFGAAIAIEFLDRKSALGTD